MAEYMTIPIAERNAILTQHEGWFGTATPEFQQAVLTRYDWRNAD